MCSYMKAILWQQFKKIGGKRESASNSFLLTICGEKQSNLKAESVSN